MRLCTKRKKIWKTVLLVFGVACAGPRPSAQSEAEFIADMQKIRGVTINQIEEKEYELSLGFDAQLDQPPIPLVTKTCRRLRVQSVILAMSARDVSAVLPVIKQECSGVKELILAVSGSLVQLELDSIGQLDLKRFTFFDRSDESVQTANFRVPTAVFGALSGLRLESFRGFGSIDANSIRYLQSARGTLVYFAFDGVDNYQTLTDELMQFPSLHTVELLGSPTKMDIVRDLAILKSFKGSYRIRYKHELKVLLFGSDIEN